jgi:hypothetical protein
MKFPRLLSLLAATLLSATAAQPDFAALQKERAALERGFEREEQKIDQAQEQAMIRIHSQERELRAAAERDGTAGVDQATYMMSGGTKGVDPEKLGQAKLAADEVSNRVNHQLTPDAEEPFQEQHAALNRRRTLELAKFDTRMVPDVEGADKLRDQQIKRAELTAQWEEKFDALEREERRAARKLEFAQTSKLNAVEAKLFVLQQRQALAAQKKMLEEAKTGRPPDMDAISQLMTAVSPEMKPLLAQKDELKNALQTAQEELSAQFGVKRTDLQNQRDDDLAKLAQ